MSTWKNKCKSYYRKKKEDIKKYKLYFTFSEKPFGHPIFTSIPEISFSLGEKKKISTQI